MITRLLFALLLGAVSVLLLMVPFVGAFTVGLLLALFCALSGSLLAPYCKNSEYVEFGFAWITVHSSQAYLVYWALFSTIMFIGLTLVSFARRAQGEERRE